MFLKTYQCEIRNSVFYENIEDIASIQFRNKGIFLSCEQISVGNVFVSFFLKKRERGALKWRWSTSAGGWCTFHPTMYVILGSGTRHQ
jgi:hypothetical protein